VELTWSAIVLAASTVAAFAVLVQLVARSAIVQASAVSAPFARSVTVTLLPAPGAVVSRTDMFSAVNAFAGASVSTSASVAVTSVIPLTAA
jgi:hypothetical protein